MTRKDFELIATTIKHLELGDSTQVYIATMFAEALEQTNTRFNKTRFIEAANRDLDPLYIADVQSASQARVDALKKVLDPEGVAEANADYAIGKAEWNRI